MEYSTKVSEFTVNWTNLQTLLIIIHFAGLEICTDCKINIHSNHFLAVYKISLLTEIVQN